MYQSREIDGWGHGLACNVPAWRAAARAREIAEAEAQPRALRGARALAGHWERGRLRAESWLAKADIAPEARFDVNAKDFVDLAKQLGC